MFNNNASWLAKGFNAFKSSISISNIIERQFFTLQYLGSGYTSLINIGFCIESCFLMRVFTVAHFLTLNKLGIEGAREVFTTFFNFTTQIVSYGRVISCCVFKGFYC